MGIFVSVKRADGYLSPVIFIHGDYQNHTVFRELAHNLAERQHTTVSFDLPGHGLSEAEESDLSNLLERIILEEQLKNPVLIGNSFGGLLAVDYARKGKVLSLALLNSPIFNMVEIYPNIDWNSKLSEYETISQQLFERQFLVDYSHPNHFTDDELTKIGLRTTSPIGVRNNMRFYRFFNEHYNIDLKIPVLLINSENDWLVPENYAREWIRQNGNRRLESIKADHNVLIQNPSMISDIVEKHHSFLFSETA